jgi:hypothetical protein
MKISPATVSLQFDTTGWDQSLERLSTMSDVFSDQLKIASLSLSQSGGPLRIATAGFHPSMISILSNGQVELLKDYEQRCFEEERMNEFYPGGMNRKEYEDTVRQIRTQFDSLEERLKRLTDTSAKPLPEETRPAPLNRHERRREAALQRKLKTRSRGR